MFTKDQASDAPSLSPEYSKLYVRPWPRYFARVFDVLVFAFIVQILLLEFYIFLSPGYSLILSFGTLLLWAFIESFFLSIFGATLGKFLFSIKLNNLNGTAIRYPEALLRSLHVWFAGLGMGLPIVFLITLVMSYRKLKSTGSTSWDKNKFIITQGKLHPLKIFMALLMIFSFLSLTLLEKNAENMSEMRNQAQTEISTQNLPTMIEKDKLNHNKINNTDPAP